MTKSKFNVRMLGLFLIVATTTAGCGGGTAATLTEQTAGYWMQDFEQFGATAFLVKSPNGGLASTGDDANIGFSLIIAEGQWQEDKSDGTYSIIEQDAQTNEITAFQWTYTITSSRPETIPIGYTGSNDMYAFPIEDSTRWAGSALPGPVWAWVGVGTGRPDEPQGTGIEQLHVVCTNDPTDHGGACGDTAFDQCATPRQEQGSDPAVFFDVPSWQPPCT